MSDEQLQWQGLNVQPLAPSGSGRGSKDLGGKPGNGTEPAPVNNGNPVNPRPSPQVGTQQARPPMRQPGAFIEDEGAGKFHNEQMHYYDNYRASGVIGNPSSALTSGMREAAPGLLYKDAMSQPAQQFRASEVQAQAGSPQYAHGYNAVQPNAWFPTPLNISGAPVGQRMPREHFLNPVDYGPQGPNVNSVLGTLAAGMDGGAPPPQLPNHGMPFLQRDGGLPPGAAGAGSGSAQSPPGQGGLQAPGGAHDASTYCYGSSGMAPIPGPVPAGGLPPDGARFVNQANGIGHWIHASHVPRE